MKKWAVMLCVGVVLALVPRQSRGQGTFQNLDFEDPVLPLQPENFQVPISQAMPGWGAGIVFTGGSRYELARVVYDTVALEAAAVSFHDRSSSIPVLQGSYSVFLQPWWDYSAWPYLHQTGTIPNDSVSLRFLTSRGYASIAVHFEGYWVPVSVLGGDGNPDYIWGGDISVFAGQTGRLEFAGSGVLDAIQFSGLPVPVPLSSTATATNTVLLSWPSRTNTFAVQANPGLSSTNWVTLTNEPVAVGFHSQVTLPMSPASTFYRLIAR